MPQGVKNRDLSGPAAKRQKLTDLLLPLLNISIPFSLCTSFDYLGFWLYALFGLLVAGPSISGSNAQKIAADSLRCFWADLSRDDGCSSAGQHCRHRD